MRPALTPSIKGVPLSSVVGLGRSVTSPQHPLSRNVSDLTPDDQEFWHYHLQDRLPFLVEWDERIDWRNLYYRTVTEDRESDILNELLLESTRAVHSTRQTNTLALIGLLLARPEVDPLYQNGEIVVQLLSKRAYTELTSLFSKELFWSRLLQNREASELILRELTESDYRRLLGLALGTPLAVKRRLLSRAIELDLTDLVKYMTVRWKLLPSDDDLTELTIQGNVSLLDLLLRTYEQTNVREQSEQREQTNVREQRELFQNLLSRAPGLRLTGEMLSLILTSQELDLDALPRESMDYIVRQLESTIETDLKNVVAFSDGLFSERDVLTMISSPESTYERLLRELLVRRVPLEGALTWLISEMKSERQSVQVLGAAANSILHPRAVVHTSPLFTAYSAFLLFCLTTRKDKNDVARVLRALEGEARVTEEGLQLAGALLGASL